MWRVRPPPASRIASWKCHQGKSIWVIFAWDPTASAASTALRSRRRVSRRACVEIPTRGGQKREIWVPLHVVSSQAKDMKRRGETTRQDPLDVPPRRQHKEKGARPPAGFDTKGLFRSVIRRNQKCERRQASLAGGVCPCEWNSRCQVPDSVYNIAEGIQSGLVSLAALLRWLQGDMALILGSVGATPVMAQLLRDSGVCWDWSVVACEGPAVMRMEAFKRVCRKLRYAHDCYGWESGRLKAGAAGRHGGGKARMDVFEI